MYCAVLIAAGIDNLGHRDILGLSVSLSEHEVHWRDFLCQLQTRGMHGVELIINDAHAGLKAARKTVFPGIPWQRCQFHLQQNAQSYVSKRSKRREVADVIRSIPTAPNERVARELLSQAVQTYEQTIPKLSSWMEENIPESFVIFCFLRNTDGEYARVTLWNGLTRKTVGVLELSVYFQTQNRVSD